MEDSGVVLVIHVPDPCHGVLRDCRDDRFLIPLGVDLEEVNPAFAVYHFVQGSHRGDDINLERFQNS